MSHLKPAGIPNLPSFLDPIQPESVSELAEIASQHKIVQNVLFAVLIILGESPNQLNQKNLVKVLTEDDFLQRCKQAKANNITPQSLDDLQLITNSVNFKPTKMGKFPPSVRCFCVWVLEM